MATEAFPLRRHSVLLSAMRMVTGRTNLGNQLAVIVGAQIADHQSALTLFQREAVQGTDLRLKRFASNALPTLRERLQMAQAAARMGE